MPAICCYCTVVEIQMNLLEVVYPILLSKNIIELKKEKTINYSNLYLKPNFAYLWKNRRNAIMFFLSTCM